MCELYFNVIKVALYFEIYGNMDIPKMQIYEGKSS